MCPPVDLGACSGCIRLLGECYRARIDPIRARKILNGARESRDCGEHLRACSNVWNGLKGIGRDDLEGDKGLASRNEPDPIPLTLSRHSITSTAVSPVNCKISFRLESSASNSINLLTSSSESNSPSSSCLGLGRESTTPDVSTRGEDKRLFRCYVW